MTFLFALMIACGGSEPAPASAPPAPPKASAAAAAEPSAPNPALLEALKTADAADGTEDKVATMCAGCALSMSGEAAHSISVEGYTLQLCSAMCKTHFSKDVAGNLQKLIN